jgi:hypothetical protein
MRPGAEGTRAVITVLHDLVYVFAVVPAVVYLLLIEVSFFSALVLGLEAEVAVGRLRRVPSLVQWIATAVLGATVVIALVAA